ncbi:uncharacterized protein METZ01_LOCUS474071 [marine metagenome]|uniref:Uncharacterized protein n=1 Tax=marine metagenome TaxID=408172 RepID=A0A383BM52_9ZZZZ
MPRGRLPAALIIIVSAPPATMSKSNSDSSPSAAFQELCASSAVNS